MDNIDRRVVDPDKRMVVRTREDSSYEMAQRLLANTSIRSFTGDYEFLTTLSKSRVVLPGEGVTEEDYLPYPTLEHALQVCDRGFISFVYSCIHITHS